MGVDHVQVARFQREVFRFDDRPAGTVDLRSCLRHLVEVREVVDGSTPPAAVEVRDEWRTVNRGVDHMVAADDDGVFRIACLHRESRWNLLDLLLDNGAVEVNAVLFDLQPGAAEVVEGPGVQEVDADLLQDQHGVVIDLLNLLLGEDVVRLQRVGPHIVSGAGVGQSPGDLAVASRLEGTGVDPLVIFRVHVSRIADALRVGGSLLGEQRDFVLGEPELVERRDVEVFGQLIDVFDANLGGLPHRFRSDLETQRLASMAGMLMW